MINSEQVSPEIAIMSPELLRPIHTTAAVLDGGSQFTAHVVRTLRKEGCDATIYPINTSFEDVIGKADVVIATGGPSDVNTSGEDEKIDKKFMDGTSALPFMGICLGMHQVVVANGGRVEAYQNREVTVQPITIVDNAGGMFEGMEPVQVVQNNHGLSSKVSDLPPGFRPTAMSGDGDEAFVAGISNELGTIVAVQFHPEVVPSENGQQMIGNFLRRNCRLVCDYVPEERHAVAARKMHVAKLSGKQVLLGFSGGVDSSVVAALAHQSMGDKLIGLHIDTGFNRKNEAKQAMAIAEHIGFKLRVVDASKEFQNAKKYFENGKAYYSPTKLKDTYDYYIERLIFSATYAQVIKKVLGEMGLTPENSWLAQGTLYTDIIESGHSGKSTATIKPHHNIGGAFTAWQEAGMLVAPLDEFFKDDVRALGSEIGLPDNIVWRQPFPGPGLMVRTMNLLCAPDFKHKRRASMLLNEFRSADDSVHILPLRYTGNAGDGPEYKHMVAITSDDGLQDRHYDLAKTIPEQVRDVSGVIYVEGGKVSHKKDVFNRVIPTDLSTRTMNLAREVDAAVEVVSVKHGLGRSIAQEPVILSAFNPVNTDGRLVLLRPVDSTDFFTADASRVGGKTYSRTAHNEQIDAAMSVKGVGAVATVLSGKPPITVEPK